MATIKNALGLPLDFLNREAGKGAAFRRDHDRDFLAQRAEIQFHVAPALGILDDARDCREKDHRGDLLGANMSRKHDGCQVASWNENIEQRFDLGSNSENMGQRNSHYWCLRLK